MDSVDDALLFLFVLVVGVAAGVGIAGGVTPDRFAQIELMLASLVG